MKGRLCDVKVINIVGVDRTFSALTAARSQHRYCECFFSSNSGGWTVKCQHSTGHSCSLHARGPLRTKKLDSTTFGNRISRNTAEERSDMDML
jgi:hypothetical protein